jgi:hypothetical protein
MSSQPTIKPDHVYWVQPDGVRIKVRVLMPSLLVPGWWICQSLNTGDQLKVPRNAFAELITEDAADQ